MLSRATGVRSRHLFALVFALLVASRYVASVSAQDAADAQPSCVWMFFIDDLHLNFPATGYLKHLLKTVFGQLVQEGDLVAVVSTGPSSIAIDTTRDHRRLAIAIDKFSGAGLKPSEIVAAPDANSSEVRYRAHVAFRAAYDAMNMVTSVRSPRQAFIYVSNGYYIDVWAGGTRMGSVNPFSLPRKEFEGSADRPSSISLEHLRDEVAELSARASHANLPIYAIDPRAFSGATAIDPKLDDAGQQKYLATTRNTLRVIAEQTGGFVIEDDLESGLKRIAAAKGR
jgi:hypothetical protein